MSQGPASETEPTSNVLTEVVEQHAIDASFLWPLRDASARSPAYDLRALSRVDARLDAHLDGLLIAGRVGSQIARDGLKRGRGGEAFVAAWLAVERSDAISLAETLKLGAGSPARARQIHGALGWVPLARARPVLHELLADDCPPELHGFGIAGCAAHRYDPGAALDVAARAADPALAARAFRAAGELGRADLTPLLLGALDGPHDACRFWAAWSAALLSEDARPRAAEALWRVVHEGGPRSAKACDIAARIGDPRLVAARLRALPTSPSHRRAAIVGAAALGDPALVPWLLERMAEPEDARLAAWAFSTITGCDLATQKLAGQPPPGFLAGPTDDPAHEDVQMSPDDALPWPDRAAILSWWSARAPELPPGVRHLVGRPIQPSRLAQILREGSQPSRRAAALELCLADPGRPLFDVYAPGPRQQRILRASEVTPCGR